MLPEEIKWLEWAIEQIVAGNVDKLQMYDMTVYRYGTIVRIDKKNVFKTYK